MFLEKARAEKIEPKRLQWYERVLELDERSAEATKGKRAILQDRGDRARDRGDFAEAAKAYREAVREDLAQQAEEQLRTIGLEHVRAQVLELERAEQYVAALELIRSTDNSFAGFFDWRPDIQRLAQAARMVTHYQHAVGALKTGERMTAQTLLAEVIAIDPRYKDAAKLLYEAVSGIDVDRRGQSEREAREDAEAATAEERAAREKAEMTAEVESRARLQAESRASAAETNAAGRVKRESQQRATLAVLAVAEGVAVAALGGWLAFRPSPTPNASADQIFTSAPITTESTATADEPDAPDQGELMFSSSEEPRVSSSGDIMSSLSPTASTNQDTSAAGKGPPTPRPAPCTQDGFACGRANDCCGRACVAHQCQQCLTPGADCNNDNECCGARSLCNHGKCARCKASGAECDGNGQCCTYCSRPNAETRGRCL